MEQNGAQIQVPTQLSATSLRSSPLAAPTAPPYPGPCRRDSALPLQFSFTFLETGAHIIFPPILDLDLQQDGEYSLQLHWAAGISFDPTREGHGVGAQDMKRAARVRASGQHQATAPGREGPLPQRNTPAHPSPGPPSASTVSLHRGFLLNRHCCASETSVA